MNGLGYAIPYGSEEFAKRQVGEMYLTKGSPQYARMQEIVPVKTDRTQFATLNHLDKVHQEDHRRFAIIGASVRDRLVEWNRKIMENNGSILQDEGFKMMLAENPHDPYITGSRHALQKTDVTIMADRVTPLQAARPNLYRHKLHPLFQRQTN